MQPRVDLAEFLHPILSKINEGLENVKNALALCTWKEEKDAYFLCGQYRSLTDVNNVLKDSFKRYIDRMEPQVMPVSSFVPQPATPSCNTNDITPTTVINSPDNQ